MNTFSLKTVNISYRFIVFLVRLTLTLFWLRMKEGSVDDGTFVTFLNVRTGYWVFVSYQADQCRRLSDMRQWCYGTSQVTKQTIWEWNERMKCLHVSVNWSITKVIAKTRSHHSPQNNNKSYCAHSQYDIAWDAFIYTLFVCMHLRGDRRGQGCHSVISWERERGRERERLGRWPWRGRV